MLFCAISLFFSLVSVHVQVVITMQHVVHNMMCFYDEHPSLQVLVDVLAGSRTSRLVSRLVLGERRLLVASAEPSFTGEKHAGLTLVYGRPLEGAHINPA